MMMKVKQKLQFLNQAVRELEKFVSADIHNDEGDVGKLSLMK